jgi:WD40 repeat protein/serine/threonine protein kinase
MDNIEWKEREGYALHEPIGEGAFGRVYRGVQSNVDREVAIKIIRPEYANQPTFIRRFETEARLVARLEHPYIVPLYDYWREPDGAYLVMRFMKGGSLKNKLSEGPLPIDDAAKFLEQIVAALAIAHKRGVIHRDLKPANVLLDETGNYFLSDFGIAKDIEKSGSETQTGSIIGTPAYMSPEQIQSAEISPQTDIYCLGIILHEILTGKHPFEDTPSVGLLIKQVQEPLPALAKLLPDLPAGCDTVIQKATSKDPDDRFEDIGAMWIAFRDALGSSSSYPTSSPDASKNILLNVENPYKGLQAFEDIDAEAFFGREDLTQRLIERLSEPHEAKRFLTVIGPSGSGKSSLIKAGLVPALRAGAVAGSENWFVVEIVPGSHPIEELELGLLGISASPQAGLADQLQRDSRGLLRATRLTLPTKDSELLLIVDQFEEIFTLLKDPDQAKHFMDLIETAVLDPRSRVRVILTLRADFYDRPLLYSGFSRLVQGRTEVVIPMNTEEISQAIERPARQLGAIWEDGLVGLIMAEVSEYPGILPMMQYALTELFEHREGGLLSHEAYREIGGVLGALGRRAEEIFSEQEDPGRTAAKQIFLRLVALGEGTEDTRRRVLRSELETLSFHNPFAAPLQKKGLLNSIIDSFGEARLLTFDRDPVSRGPTVEVAHEALLREWPRLRDWLEDSRDDLRTQRNLRNAAREWIAGAQDASFLLHGYRLEQLEAWTQTSHLALSADELSFMKACVAERDVQREQEEIRRVQEEALKQRSRNFLRALVGVFAAAAVVSIILTSFFFRERNLAVQNEGLAADNAATATVAQGQALLDAATAVAAQEQLQILVRAEAEARLIAERATNLSISRELVTAAQVELLQATDPSRSLALLLASQAVLATWTRDGYVTPEAENILRAAIDQAPILLKRLEGHSDEVTIAKWSPDGAQIATASADSTVRIWNGDTGEQILLFQGHISRVTAVGWSRDGAQLLSAEQNGTVIIWNLSTGTQLRQIQNPTTALTHASWSPEADRIAISDNSGGIHIWDAISGELLVFIEGHTSAVNFVSWNPDGSQLATASSDTTVRIWEVASGAQISRLEAKAGLVSSVAWSQDGQRLLTTHRTNLARLWDIPSGEAIFDFIHQGNVQDAVWSPDENQIGTITLQGTIQIWDSQSGALIRQMQAKEQVLWSVDWHPTGSQILTADGDGMARIWESRTLASLAQLEHDSQVLTVAWSSSGDWILTAGSNSLSASIWEAQTGRELTEFVGHDGPVQAAVWSPDGEQVATASQDGTAIVWDVRTGLKLLRLSGHRGAINDVAWSPDGHFIATAGQDRTIRIWDARSGSEHIVLEGHSGAVVSVDWHPFSSLVLSTGQDSSARVWNSENGEEILQLLGHSDRVNDGAWSPTGDMIVTAGSDQVARIWDSQSGAVLHTLSGHREAVWAASWSPKGDQIVTASSDGTVRFWDPLVGTQLAEIAAHEAIVWSAAWNPNQAIVATASADRTVRTLSVGIEFLLEQAQSLILRIPAELSAEEKCVYLHQCEE